MYRTTKECTVKLNLDVAVVPKGTRVIGVKGGGGVTYYAVDDRTVLLQINEHDRKYHYLYVPSEIVEKV
jgi:hypothetical protein